LTAIATQNHSLTSDILTLKVNINMRCSKKYALRIVVEILFEVRKKIGTKSLAEGNAQIILIKILLILLKAKKHKKTETSKIIKKCF
jgi:hypothetical protein